jgi:hypothetical protein
VVPPFVNVPSESFFEGQLGEENFLDVEYINDNEKPPKSIKELQLPIPNKSGKSLVEKTSR